MTTILYVYLAGVALLCFLAWLGYASMWAEADPGEHRPPLRAVLCVALLVMVISAFWPLMVVWGAVMVVRGKGDKIP